MKVGTQEKNTKSGNQETRKNSREIILNSWLPDYIPSALLERERDELDAARYPFRGPHEIKPRLV
jgi:hypothetical protein